MFPVRMEHFCGKGWCTSEAELRAAFDQSRNGFNDLCFFPNEEELFPYLDVLINQDFAYIWYVPDEASAGIQAWGTGLGLPSGGVTLFQTSERMEIPNEYVLPKETALQVTLEFLRRSTWPARCGEMPALVEWEEL